MDGTSSLATRVGPRTVTDQTHGQVSDRGEWSVLRGVTSKTFTKKSISESQRFGSRTVHGSLGSRGDVPFGRTIYVVGGECLPSKL